MHLEIQNENCFSKFRDWAVCKDIVSNVTSEADNLLNWPFLEPILSWYEKH